jgi:hypothetical protein
MKRYTQKELRRLVNNGTAIDLTKSHNILDIDERYEQVGYSKGIYGCNGKLLEGESGQLYAITTATSALYIF